MTAQPKIATTAAVIKLNKTKRKKGERGRGEETIDNSGTAANETKQNKRADKQFEHCIQYFEWPCILSLSAILEL